MELSIYNNCYPPRDVNVKYVTIFEHTFDIDDFQWYLENVNKLLIFIAEFVNSSTMTGMFVVGYITCNSEYPHDHRADKTLIINKN